MKRADFLTSKTSLVIVGVLVGVLLMAGIRVATYKMDHTHYHANFAVFINGKQETFKDPRYYQELAICKVGHGISDPQERTHMHEQQAGLVHIHDHAVTWGQFFNNIGWTLGIDFIIDDSGNKFIAGGTNKLYLLIDGQDYTDLTSLSNMVIKDQSKILLSYGHPSETDLKDQSKSIPNNAKHADESTDPGSCAAKEKMPFKERLHHVF